MEKHVVSILVLMEVARPPFKLSNELLGAYDVSILVLMEVARPQFWPTRSQLTNWVSILVLMEVARPHQRCDIDSRQ